MLLCLLLVTSLVAVGSAGHSPNADYVQSLYKSGAFGARYSDNIQEDASLDAPALVKKYGYPIEIHDVTTPDGYILQMHRIPHGRDKNNQPGPRPVIFLMHGLLSSSADWVIMGPGTALAYYLAEEGFDVWMGNARGNYYSRRHISLNPDALLSTRFWRFSWDEIGNIDLAAMIDYALEKSDQQSLHYIGHSQGTTSFFVLTSLRPEYNAKIKSMHAYAPVAYMANNRNIFLNIIAQYANNIESILSLIGVGEFMSNGNVLSMAGQALCRQEVLFQPICSNMLFLIGGWNVEQHNATMIPLILAHTPAGASARQFVHYGQGIAEGHFRRYNHGWLGNMQNYGSLSPTKYPLSRITAPVFLHYSDNDPLAHVNDVFRLYRELGQPIGLFHIPRFSHLDFIWGVNAKELLFERTVNLIRAMENV